MIREFSIAFLLFFLAHAASAQFLRSPERAAIKLMEDNRWKKAEALLRREISREPANILAKYLMSDYYFNPGNPDYKLDSAYHYVLAALSDFRGASPKSREKIDRFPLDSAAIMTLREKIDSAVFEEVKSTHTEAAYIRFMEDHPFSTQRDLAARLRDEVAYLDAIKRNTYQSFLEFLEKYPRAAQAPDAKRNYDRLLFETRTADKKLSSYERFLRENPETPFRQQVEKNIFELVTLSGEPDRFTAFLESYPTSRYATRARNLLFHILENTNPPILTDSLRQVSRLQESYLVPFLTEGKFGLMDKNGVAIIPPVMDRLPDEYRCGNIAEDIIVLDDRLLARNGCLVYSGEILEFDDLGAGFLKLRTLDCTRIIHKSGLSVHDCIDDAKVLGRRFLAIRRGNQWMLESLSGRQLLGDAWQEVALHGDVFTLKKNGQWRLLTVRDLLESMETGDLALSGPYDEVKLLPKGRIGVSLGAQRSILDQTLSKFIPEGDQEINAVPFGFSVRSSAGTHLYNDAGARSPRFAKVVMHGPWVGVTNDSLWHLFDTRRMEMTTSGFDSIAFEGPFLKGFENDSLTVHFRGMRQRTFPAAVNVQFIPGRDSTSFLMAEIEGEKTVYNLAGDELFTGSFDGIHHAGRDLFIVARDEKKGLVDSGGKVLLPVEFDAIGSLTGDVISLLRKRKFGLYHAGSGKLIKPAYDKNLVPYRDDLVAAFKDGSCGFIDWDSKSQDDFRFDEVMYWNDSTAFVREGSIWSLYNISERSALGPRLRHIDLIRDTPEEKLAIVQSGSAYGVLSSVHGQVIPVTFTDLVNVGSAEEPLYFTEKHVPEASIFVVIYYDRMGKLLRREVYEDVENYEKIYCPRQ